MKTRLQKTRSLFLPPTKSNVEVRGISSEGRKSRFSFRPQGSISLEENEDNQKNGNPVTSVEDISNGNPFEEEDEENNAEIQEKKTEKQNSETAHAQKEKTTSFRYQKSFKFKSLKLRFNQSKKRCRENRDENVTVPNSKISMSSADDGQG